jgi:tetratricopeptide (TPR) repeat protein
LDEVAEAVEDIPLTLKKRPEILEQKIIAANAAKDRGNGYLKEGAVEEAIKAYSLAIQLDNTNHVFFSNRCAALQQKKMWALAVADAEEVCALFCSVLLWFIAYYFTVQGMERMEEGDYYFI